jgi:hypothetical protein
MTVREVIQKMTDYASGLDDRIYFYVDGQLIDPSEGMGFLGRFVDDENGKTEHYNVFSINLE